MEKDYLLLSQILRDRRIELGYSQRSLARVVGVHHSTINDYENGFKRKWDLVILIDLCNVLRINFVTLLILTNFLPLSYADDGLKELINKRRKYEKEKRVICHFCPLSYFEGERYGK